MLSLTVLAELNGDMFAGLPLKKPQLLKSYRPVFLLTTSPGNVLALPGELTIINRSILAGLPLITSSPPHPPRDTLPLPLLPLKVFLVQVMKQSTPGMRSSTLAAANLNGI